MADGKDRFCNGHCVFRCRGHDRPLLRDACYRTLITWEVKYDMQGLEGVWEGVSDQTTEGGGDSIGTAQLGGPGFTTVLY
jgi:hypothetical protein